MWGCVEVGHIGIECDAHEGMHMTDDLIVTEFVDDKNRPARKADCIARVLVTSLFGRTLPLIRYELRDIPVPGDNPCSCGAHFPLISGVKGRADDIFVYTGGIHIHPLVFRTPLARIPTLPNTRFAKPRTAPVSGWWQAGQSISRHYAGRSSLGLPHPVSMTRKSRSIASTAWRHKETGKLRRFIPLDL
jgi:hypothetical protein